MTYDPDKLRHLLLGDDSDHKDTPDEPVQEHPDKKEQLLKPYTEEKAPHVAPATPPPAAPEPRKQTEQQELEKVNAEVFAPLRKMLLTDDEKPKETPKPQEPSAAGASSADGSIAKPEKKAAEKKSKGKKAEPKPLVVRKSLPISPPSPLTLLSLGGGVLALLGALVASIAGAKGSAPLILTAIGIALTASFLFVNRRWVKMVLSGRSARYSANVTTVILSLFGILVLLNVLSYRYYYRIDLSAEGLHTLSPQTLQILDDINRAGEKVTITAFIPSTDSYRQVVDNLYQLYRYHSDKLEFSFVDPNVKLDFTKSKGIDRVPSVLFELGDKRQVISDINESQFTAALVAVRSTSSRTAAFLTGHGEPDPLSEDTSQSGLSLFRARLELDNFKVSELNIPESNGVPADTSLLIIVSPLRDLDPREIDAISSYLDTGGSVIAFLEPGRSGGLAGLLAQYGVIANSDTVLDDQNNYYGDPAAIRVTGNPESPIASGLSDGMLFLNSGSLDFTAFGRLSDVETESVVRSSASAWSESADEFAFNEGIDTRKAYEMAIYVKRPLSPATDSEPAKISQLFVVNDASLVENANFDAYMNRDFALNAANFLTQSADLMSVRASVRTARPLSLSRAQRVVVFSLSVVLIPLAIAGMGIFVWLRRR